MTCNGTSLFTFLNGSDKMDNEINSHMEKTPPWARVHAQFFSSNLGKMLMPRIRLPAPEEIAEILSGVSKHSEKAESKLRKALGMALASMAEKEKEALVEALRPLSWQQIKALCYPEKWSRLDRGYAVAVIKTMRELDASMLTIYPAINKPATRLPNNEEMNIISRLFKHAARTMFAIGNGHHAKHVRMVFGSDQEVVNRARNTFTASAEALHRLLRKEGGVVIDELRKDAVWGCGGLTTQAQMALPVSAVKLDFEDALLTVVHEATHAAISPWDTTDHYYEYHDQFKKASPEIDDRGLLQGSRSEDYGQR